MPAPSASAILANPPPLTPRALRNFPYRVRPFPIAGLIAPFQVWPRATTKALLEPAQPEKRVQ